MNMLKNKYRSTLPIGQRKGSALLAIVLVVAAVGSMTAIYAQMPSHAHSRGSMNITGTAEWACDDGASTGCFYRIGYNNCTDSGGQRQQTIGFDASRSWTGVTSYEGSNQPHENRPPYYALYYIMKV